MFLPFFYYLRKEGLDVSVDEWLTLSEALHKGLAFSGLTSFYQLCRLILVKSEVDFDLFDQAFAKYFSKIKDMPDIPQAFYEWLSENAYIKDLEDVDLLQMKEKTLEEMLKDFYDRLESQKEKHDKGNYYIGTGGSSSHGHSGFNLSGLRLGGEGHHKRALKLAEERHFKDFREDQILDLRQFQMAFRKLRKYSKGEDKYRELDIDGTVRNTCDRGGLLELAYKRPRKNTIKMLMLIDSGGSMLPYARITNKLFQAVSQANHFSDLKVYFFHNCIYDNLYKNPLIKRDEMLETNRLFNQLGDDYKLILLGDAAMAPSELFMRGGNSILGLYNRETGISWLKRIKGKFPQAIWLNPIATEKWPYVYGSASIDEIKKIFPMYELTLEGLEQGIKKLLNR